MSHPFFLTIIVVSLIYALYSLPKYSVIPLVIILPLLNDTTSSKLGFLTNTFLYIHFPQTHQNTV